MCYRVVSEDLYLIVYCSDQYNFQIMCNITADYSAAALKLIPNWFVTSKMMKNLFNALYTDESFLRFQQCYIFVLKWVFLIQILIILRALNNNSNNNLGDNFDEDGPDTVIHIRLLTWNNKLEKRKALKKELSEKLMPIVQHLQKWWKFCVSEDKKEREQTFTERL